MTRHDLEARVVQCNCEDGGSRKEFIPDPSGAFVKYLQAPAEWLPKIAIHEETASSWHVVLPEKAAKTGALSEADLERVAGGATPATAIGLTVVTATYATAYVSLVEGGW
jgi:hypothetical protein